MLVRSIQIFVKENGKAPFLEWRSQQETTSQIIVDRSEIREHKVKILRKQKNIGESMANRNRSYDSVIAKSFENRKYAQGYLLNIVENEGLSVEEALRETIKAMGLQNFSKKSGLSIQAVSDFVSKRRKWSADKIKKHIEQVFKLKVRLSLEVA